MIEVEGSEPTNDNMVLWNKHSKTDGKFLKDVKMGTRKFKSIQPHSQIMDATKEWGPFGIKWGVKDERFTPCFTDRVIYQAILFYPEGEILLHSDICIFTSVKKSPVDDWSKKVATDALTKGLSKLGFNADVFLGEWDSKYCNNDASQPRQKVQPSVNRFGVIKDIKALYSDSWNDEQKAWFTTLDTQTDTQLCNALSDLKG